MDFNDVQLRKHFSPKVVTDDGITMDSNDVQYPKQAFPILVTDDGILMDFNDVQEKYLEVIDYQLFVVNTVEKWIGCYLWVYGK